MEPKTIDKEKSNNKENHNRRNICGSVSCAFFTIQIEVLCGCYRVTYSSYGALDPIYNTKAHSSPLLHGLPSQKTPFFISVTILSRIMSSYQVAPQPNSSPRNPSTNWFHLSKTKLSFKQVLTQEDNIHEYTFMHVITYEHT